MDKIFGDLVGQFLNSDGTTTYIYLDGNSMRFVNSEKVVASLPVEDVVEAVESHQLDA